MLKCEEKEGLQLIMVAERFFETMLHFINHITVSLVSCISVVSCLTALDYD